MNSYSNYKLSPEVEARLNNLAIIWERDGVAVEVAYWRKVLNSITGAELQIPAKVCERMSARLIPQRPLQDYPKRLLTEVAQKNSPPFGLSRKKPPLKILDAGSGPFTQLGTYWDGQDIELTAVDALADHYNQLIEEFKVSPPVRTTLGQFETLPEIFGENAFDLVWTQNSLDHAYNPITGLQTMVRVAKPGRCVSVMLFEDEGKRENYKGMHQWNFSKHGDDVLISTKDGDEALVSEIVEGMATLETVRYVSYFSDEDTSGIETLSDDQVAELREKKRFVWMQFLLRKNEN